MPNPLTTERLAEIDKVISLGVLAKRGRHMMAAVDLRAEVTRLKQVVELWKTVAYRAQEGTLSKKLLKPEPPTPGWNE